MMKRRLVTMSLTVALAASWALAETVRCQGSRDVWISAANSQEVDTNGGAAAHIKLKVWQEFGLVDFDVSALKGKPVTKAWLYVKPAGGHKLALNGGTDLRWLTVSTVSHDWVEGKGTSYTRDAAGHGATFNESSYQRANWGFPGAKAWDVILGHGNTLRAESQLEPAEGRLKAPIDPRMVRAMVAGATHGLLLMDGSTSVGVNCTIASRESGNGPYLEVATAGEDATPPQPPARLRVEPAPNWATPTLGAATVSFTSPDGAFAYRVSIDGKPLARWQIPFAPAEAGAVSFPVVDLTPGARVKVEVAAVDAAGNFSKSVSATGKVSPRLTVPTLPASPFKPKGGPPKKLGQAKVWAFPEITKVDPVSGKVLGETLPGDIRRANAVWDGATGTIRLAAARGEIVSFQIAVEGEIRGVGVEVSDLAVLRRVGSDAGGGPTLHVVERASTIPKAGVKLWRNWYVRRHSEYAIPLKGTFDCPMADNGIAGQTLQAVTVDLHVPKDAKAGGHFGRVTLSAGDDKLDLPLMVKVYDVVIPDEVHFNPELNCYGGPGQAGSAKFKDSFRLAHYHRCTINRVPYSQGGRVHGDWIPRIDAAGRVTDWSNFDTNLAGLLDGSWFKLNPRAGVPVPTLYLPMFEGWPKDFRRHYHPGEGVAVNGKDADAKLRHDALAKPIEQAMDEGFKAAWVNCLSDFVAHAKDKGWNRTLFECYLNNKPNYGYTMWTLDEPFEYLDWAALNFFGRLWKQGVDDPAVYTRAWHEAYFREGLAGMNRPRPTFVFRGDISRLMWQGSTSDGLMNIVYLGGGGLGMPRMVRRARVRMPAIMYAYGSANAFGRNNWESAAWCLRAYTNYCDGVLPWQSLGGAAALSRGDAPGQGNSLVIDTGGKFGHAVASFRVHALRRGAQDCELLRLLQLKRGWSRDHIGLLAAQRVPLTAKYRQAFADEAAAMTFGRLTSQGFCEMKEGVLQLLAAK